MQPVLLSLAEGDDSENALSSEQSFLKAFTCLFSKTHEIQ